MIEVNLNSQSINLLAVYCTMQMMNSALPPDDRRDSQSLLRDIDSMRGTLLCLSSVRSMKGYVRASEKVMNTSL